MDTSFLYAAAASQIHKDLYFSIYGQTGRKIRYVSDPYPGHGIDASFSIVFQPSDKWSTTLTVSYSDFFRESDGGREFDDGIVRFRNTFQMNRYLFFRAILEYNSFYEMLTTDFLGFIHLHPGDRDPYRVWFALRAERLVGRHRRRERPVPRIAPRVLFQDVLSLAYVTNDIGRRKNREKSNGHLYDRCPGMGGDSILGQEKLDCRGPYLGQALPGMTAELFAPGVISTGLTDRDIAVSPDGGEIFYGIYEYPRFVILRLFQNGGQWKREVAPFLGVWDECEPHFSDDGNRLYYASKRPLDGKGGDKGWDVWFVERKAEGWGEPKNLGAPVNTEKDEFYPSFTKSGALYLTSWDMKILRCPSEGGVLGPAEALSDSVNSGRAEYNACIAPDESFLIFTSHGWDKNAGRGDLFRLVPETGRVVEHAKMSRGEFQSAGHRVREPLPGREGSLLCQHAEEGNRRIRTDPFAQGHLPANGRAGKRQTGCVLGGQPCDRSGPAGSLVKEERE